MKKQYISPSLEIYAIKPAGLMAASIPNSGETTDSEARSKEFWGNTIFDEEPKSEEKNTDSWY